MNKEKPINSFIPNFIHSMDTSNIVLLVKKAEELNLNIITIHDCFGTHPNYMEDVFNIVKDEFIQIYLCEDFLNKFHERNIQSIKDYGCELKFNDKIQQHYVKVEHRKERIYIPNKPLMGTFDLNNVKNSKYMIT